MDHPTVVRRFSTHAEAELAKGALIARGVEALVSSDDAGGQYPGLGFANGVDLLVDSEQLAEAEEVLRASASSGSRFSD